MGRGAAWCEHNTARAAGGRGAAPGARACRARAYSVAVSIPAFMWGSRPVSLSTAAAASIA